MKKLIKNYIDLLTIEKIKDFSIKNNINLSDNELNYLLNLVKNNYEDIMKDDTNYLKEIENKINPVEFKKLKDLYLYYKTRYKGYLF